MNQRGKSQLKSDEDEKVKRVVPSGLQKFLAWDAELTNYVTDFIQRQLPDVTKSETKFMEVPI